MPMLKAACPEGTRAAAGKENGTVGTPWKYWLPPKRLPVIPPRLFLRKRTVLTVRSWRSFPHFPTMATGNWPSMHDRHEGPREPFIYYLSLSGLSAWPSAGVWREVSEKAREFDESRDLLTGLTIKFVDQFNLTGKLVCQPSIAIANHADMLSETRDLFLPSGQKIPQRSSLGYKTLDSFRGRKG